MPENVGKLHGFLGGCNIRSKYIGRGWGVYQFRTTFCFDKEEAWFCQFFGCGPKQSIYCHKYPKYNQKMF